jgi:ribonuclease HI
MDKLRSDNVNLYEKIRFLQSYPNKVQTLLFPHLPSLIMYQASTSGMRMEIEVVTAAFRWLSRQQFRHYIIVIDLQSMLRKVENAMMRSEWMMISSIPLNFLSGSCGK